MFESKACIAKKVPPQNFPKTTKNTAIENGSGHFALGNLLAFIPFGILVPIVFEHYFKTYFKFIPLFMSLILCLKIVQLVTYLGSFDIEDILINTMGATIGFCSYKISERMNTSKKYWVSMGLSIVGLTFLMFLIALVFNNTITPYLEKTFGL